MFRWYLISLVIWILSKQVMKEFRVTGITEKVNSIKKMKSMFFAENFVMQILEEVFHDERKL